VAYTYCLETDWPESKVRCPSLATPAVIEIPASPIF
jgi:hypothetical protein